MKKLCVIFAAVMTAVTVWWLFGCGGANADISERRCGYFTASDGEYTVTAVSGAREEVYAADGVAGELVPYTLVTLVPRDGFDIDAHITYSAAPTGASRTFSGAMVAHPFGASYSAEFPFEAEGGLTVSVTVKGETRTFELKSLVTPDMIDYRAAIDAALALLKPTGEHEVRARLIKSPVGDGLCWHVALYFAGGEKRGALLDPVTAKALAVKT